MVAIPEEIKEAIQHSILGYLHTRTEALPYTLKEDANAMTHGSLLNGELLRCLVGSKTLPAGTEGWLFETPKIHYSGYVWIGDEQYPAKGADILQTGSYYTFVTLVEMAGEKVLVDAFKDTTYPARTVGKVS